MHDPYALLDMLTKLLAYAGDMGARDGYLVINNNYEHNTYSVPIRGEPLSGEELEDLMNQLKNLLENDEPLVGMPDDIVEKANELKAAFDNVSQQNMKDELIEFMSEYEVNPMQGGMRKRKNKKSRKSKRKSKRSAKGRRNTKTRKSRK